MRKPLLPDGGAVLESYSGHVDIIVPDNYSKSEIKSINRLGEDVMGEKAILSVSR